MFKISLYKSLLLVLITSGATLNVFSEVVIEDEKISVSREELENAIKYWPKNLRKKAVEDKGVRYDLLNQFMINHKIAEEMKKVTVENDQEFYWQHEFAVRNLQNKLFIEHYKKNLKIPDMSLLAKEKLLVDREKYSANPKERKASHILIKCIAGTCEREEKRIIAKRILAELNKGADFEKLVDEYSDDPGSKARKGKLKSWIILGVSRVDPYFIEGVFAIEKVGDYAEVETQFGLHIIRLDEIKEVSYKKEEEVLPSIIKRLEGKYRNLSEIAFITKLSLTDNAFIKNKVIDELLTPYKVVKQSGESAKKSTLIIKKFKRP